MNWMNPEDHITDHFQVKEALFLPRWGLLHNPTPTERTNIILTANAMEQVRALFGRPIKIHCWIRPLHADTSHPANAKAKARQFDGGDYNALVKGAAGSQHIYGKAVDFHVIGMKVSEATRIILPHLERIGIRMEKHDGLWIHIDTKPVREDNNRYFVPR